ncbi:MAG: ribbon-helix-helix domain-containing protein [Nanoarchaeota archaeon]|nr:ribbon-helix-helix domain-containing protein [Nanoarchaeota archaeon]MBU1643986.1 ribbon-helix-helix domain-containing protein [Nanoarchaeota archaeon]MBU1977081.1 ribbon-helix-helix domain-containing protein [Nanoarchaeota archaeon]
MKSTQQKSIYLKVAKGFKIECIIAPYTMKKKLSITLEENTITQLEDFVNNGKFRNKSHLIKFAITKLMNEVQNGSY